LITSAAHRQGEEEHDRIGGHPATAHRGSGIRRVVALHPVALLVVDLTHGPLAGLRPHQGADNPP